MATLRIVFPPPGLFITDVRMTLALDGQPVYDGSFRSGMDVSVEVAPGAHRLESRIELGPAARTRAWDIDVDAEQVTVQIAYSRFWGNFKKGLERS